MIIIKYLSIYLSIYLSFLLTVAERQNDVSIFFVTFLFRNVLSVEPITMDANRGAPTAFVHAIQAITLFQTERIAPEKIAKCLNQPTVPQVS